MADEIEVKGLLQSIVDAEMQYRKSKNASSRGAAARRIMDQLSGSETTSRGDTYIIVADGVVVTADVAEQVIKDIQQKNAVPEERTFKATVSYFQDIVAPLALAAEKENPEGYKKDPMWVLYDSFLSYMDGNLPLRKFAETTQRLNKALGTTSAKVRPFDAVESEAKKVSEGYTTMERPKEMGTPMQEKFNPGDPGRYIIIPKNITIKTQQEAKKEFESYFTTNTPASLKDPVGYSVPAKKYYLRIDNPGKESCIIKGNIGWVKKEGGLVFSYVSYETQDLSPLDPNAYVELNAGHAVGDKVQAANLIAKGELTKDIISSGINPFTNEKFSGDVLAQAYKFLEEKESAVAIDKLVGSYSLENIAISGGMNAEKLIKPFETLARALGVREIQVVESVTPGEVTSRKSSTLYKYDTRIVSHAEYGRFNQLKGAYQSSKISDASKSFSAFILLLVSEVKAYTTESPSMFSEFVAAQLIEMLSPLMKPSDKKKLIATLLDKRKVTKRVFLKHNISKPRYLVDLNKVALLQDREKREVLESFRNIQTNAKSMVTQETKLHRKRRKLRRLNNPYSPKASGNFTSVSIIAALNDTLREEVIDAMGSPGLVNRTGTFAGSAKVTDALLPSTVGFTYKPDPYRVFSTRHGAPPWNSNPNRDPGSIIRQAIRVSMDKKFPGVFKPGVKILER
jgi:hypothetical protein